LFKVSSLSVWGRSRSRAVTSGCISMAVARLAVSPAGIFLSASPCPTGSRLHSHSESFRPLFSYRTRTRARTHTRTHTHSRARARGAGFSARHTCLRICRRTCCRPPAAWQHCTFAPARVPGAHAYARTHAHKHARLQCASPTRTRSPTLYEQCVRPPPLW